MAYSMDDSWWSAPPQRYHQTAVISDIPSWLQSFSIYTAILVSADATTKEKGAGLAAHTCLMIQLSKDLIGLQWLKYDHMQVPGIAAAKGVRNCGEKNFPFMGCCLASQQLSTYYPLSTTASALREEPLQRSVTAGRME